MDKKFLLNTSLTTGYGNNKTQKTIILDDFPKVMSLITKKQIIINKKYVTEVTYLRNTHYENTRIKLSEKVNQPSQDKHPDTSTHSAKKRKTGNKVRK